MNNISVTDLETTGNISDTNLVTTHILNTHCIVCGKAFQHPRKSKLYCSPRCKQFGYNHKNEINEVLSIREKGINKKPIIFFIDDYLSYDQSHKLLRQFKELKRKQLKWESVEQQIKLNNQYGIQSSDYLWSAYIKERLTDEEEGSLYNAETSLDERLMELASKDLSIEQWSFIKNVYPGTDDISFFEMVCSLSREFIQQLSLDEAGDKKKNEYSVIKNRYINHCNLIASGVIKFEKKKDSEQP